MKLLKKIIFIVILFFCFLPFSYAKSQNRCLLVIYSSSDYGEISPCGCRVPTGGLAHRAGVIDKLKASGVPFIILSAGDIFTYQGYKSKLFATAILKAMNYMGYDAICLGDEDFRLGRCLKDVLRQAHFKIILTNLYVRSFKGIKNIVPYLIIRRAGIRIAIVSLIDPSLLNGELIEKFFPHIVCYKPRVRLRAIIDKIKGHVDFIILLSHMGLRQTEKLVSEIKGIDMAIVGHFPNTCSNVIKEDGCLIVQTGRAGRQLSVIRLCFNNKLRLISFKNRLIVLNNFVPTDPKIKKLVLDTQRKARGLWRKMILEQDRKHVPSI